MEKRNLSVIGRICIIICILLYLKHNLIQLPVFSALFKTALNYIMYVCCPMPNARTRNRALHYPSDPRVSPRHMNHNTHRYYLSHYNHLFAIQSTGINLYVYAHHTDQQSGLSFQ